MTEAELLQALLVKPSAEGRTTEEWAAKLKVSLTVTRKILKAGIAKRKVVVGRAMRQGLDGRQMPIPVYRVVR